MRLRSTKQWQQYWLSRKTGWREAFGAGKESLSHPHRGLIIAALRSLPWLSLFEVGMGAGANLIRIKQAFPERDVGGADLSPEAVSEATTVLKGGVFRVEDTRNLLLSDKSTDIVLSDMHLIYLSPRDIHTALEEMKRVARTAVILCEFHSESWISRLKLKVRTGYNAYNYKQLLHDHGFYDIQTYKLKENDWPGGQPQKEFAFLLKAKVPRR